MNVAKLQIVELIKSHALFYSMYREELAAEPARLDAVEVFKGIADEKLAKIQVLLEEIEVFKCPIVNTDAINQHCGYGEGKTWQEAQQNALEWALKSYPDAKIECSVVVVSMGAAL